MHRYKDLIVWKSSRELCYDIYVLTGSFPTSEKYGMIDQMRRSVVSISSNIAEGSSRSSQKEFKRYIEIALGSAYELETQLLIASDLEFVTDEDFKRIDKKLIAVIKMMMKFRSKLMAS